MQAESLPSRKSSRLSVPHGNMPSAAQAQRKFAPIAPASQLSTAQRTEHAAAARHYVPLHRFMTPIPGMPHTPASNPGGAGQGMVLQRAKFYASGNEYDTDKIIQDPSSVSSKRSVKPELESIVKVKLIKNKIGVKGNAINRALRRKATEAEIKEAQAALDAITNSVDNKKKESRKRKRERDDLERERIVEIAKNIPQDEHEKGRALSRFASRRIAKINASRLESPRVKKAIKTLDDQTPGAYDAENDPSLLDDVTPYEATLALSNTKTSRFDHKIQGVKVSLDGYDSGRDQARDPTKTSGVPHLPTVKIGISNKSSYRHFSESATPPPHHPGHPLLLGLETQRNLESSATNLAKEAQYQKGGLTHTQRYSPESQLSFMEPQKANSPYPELQKVQEASAFKVFEHGNATIPTVPLGTQVNGKEQTTSQKLFTAFTGAYQPTGDKAEKFEKKKELSKEFLRLTRSTTDMDIDSDEDNLSDEELGPDYGD